MKAGSKTQAFRPKNEMNSHIQKSLNCHGKLSGRSTIHQPPINHPSTIHQSSINITLCFKILYTQQNKVMPQSSKTCTPKIILYFPSNRSVGISLITYSWEVQVNRFFGLGFFPEKDPLLVFSSGLRLQTWHLKRWKFGDSGSGNHQFNLGFMLVFGVYLFHL